MWVNGAQRTFRAMKLLCMILLDWPKICSDFSITAYGENLTGQPITMVEAYYKFVQIHRMYTTKNLKVLWACVIMMDSSLIQHIPLW